MTCPRRFWAALVLLISGVAAAAGEPASSRLVALVGDRPVTARDLADHLRVRGIEPAAATRRDWKNALEGVTHRLVILGAARREGLRVSDREVAEALRSPGRGVSREIRVLRLNAEQAAQRVRERLLVERLLAARLGTALFVSPQAVFRWYTNNKDLLASPELRVVRVITVPWGAGEGGAGSGGEAARRKIAEIRGQALRGADFAALARQHSADPWAAKGGLLDPIVKGAGGSLFAERTFALEKPGAVTQPFQTRMGSHILRLERITPAKVPTFEDAQEGIRERLRDELRAKHLPRLVRELRQRTTVRVFWQQLPWPEE